MLSSPRQQKPGTVCHQRIGQVPIELLATSPLSRVCTQQTPERTWPLHHQYAHQSQVLLEEARCRSVVPNCACNGRGVWSCLCSPAGGPPPAPPCLALYRPAPPCTLWCDGFSCRLPPSPSPTSPSPPPIPFRILHSALWLLSPGTAALLLRSPPLRPPESTPSWLLAPRGCQNMPVLVHSGRCNGTPRAGGLCTEVYGSHVWRREHPR